MSICERIRTRALLGLLAMGACILMTLSCAEAQTEESPDAKKGRTASDTQEAKVAERYPVIKGQKWGFADRSGKVVIERKYDRIAGFTEGVAAVSENGVWGFIDEDGKMVIPSEYAWAFRFSEGLAKVTKKGKWGFINKKGEMVIEEQFADAKNFSEGLSAVRMGEEEEGPWGYIDKDGDIAIAGKYEKAQSFSEGLACVTIDGSVGYIDKQGEFVVKAKFKNGRSFTDGLAAVQVGEKWGYIDKEGKWAIEPKYVVALEFYEGLAMVADKKSHIYVDKNGNEVFRSEREYKNSRQVSDLIYGRVDKSVTTTELLRARFGFADGLASVEHGSGWGYLDRTGKVAIDLKYGTAWPFQDEIAAVYVGGEMRYIDKEGNDIWASEEEEDK